MGELAIKHGFSWRHTGVALSEQNIGPLSLEDWFHQWLSSPVVSDEFEPNRPKPQQNHLCSCAELYIIHEGILSCLHVTHRQHGPLYKALDWKIGGLTYTSLLPLICHLTFCSLVAPPGKREQWHLTCPCEVLCSIRTKVWVYYNQL